MGLISVYDKRYLAIHPLYGFGGYTDCERAAQGCKPPVCFREGRIQASCREYLACLECRAYDLVRPIARRNIIDADGNGTDRVILAACRGQQ